MIRLRFTPKAFSEMLTGLTEKEDVETYGNLIGVMTREGPIIKGTVFSHDEEYSDRTSVSASAIPRGGAVQQYLVTGQLLCGIAHSHGPRMSAFMSRVDLDGFKPYFVGSASVVVGRDIKAFVQTEHGTLPVPYEICWNYLDKRLITSRLDWKISSLVVNSSSDPIVISSLHQEELKRIVEIKAFAANSSYVLYVNILNRILLRVWELKDKTVADLIKWLEALLGYANVGKLRLYQKGVLLPEAFNLSTFEEFTLLNATLEVS